MEHHDLVGIVLVAGLVVFLVGAGGWRLEYDRPLRDALPVIHGDRRRRAWVHPWMIPAMFTTRGRSTPPLWAHADTAPPGVMLRRS